MWKNVEKYWELYAQEDLEDLMSYFHDDYLGWQSGDWVPTNKADRRARMERSFETHDSVYYRLKPVGIKIFGNVAVVHYFFTDILMQHGDRWVMIGDAGGTATEDDG